MTGGVSRAEAETLNAARIHEIAAWLPVAPAGFGWSITNRAAWNQLAANPAFKNAIPQAEALLTKPIPPLPDSLYLEYSRDGNRTHWQNVAFARRGRIATLTLAEALENRGRFLPALEQVIKAICAERTWIYPAHDRNLKNFHGEEITPELGATGLAAELAEADYVLGDRLPPATRRLILDNVKRRVLDPVRKAITDQGPALWWLKAPMNWNAVCLGNTVFSALTLLPSREDRAFFATAGEHYIHYYLSGFTPDGYCAEGVGYWNYGYGHFILLTEALRQATAGRIDLLKDDKATAAALFCLRSEIFPGIFPTISDCHPGTRPDSHLVGYVRRRLGLNHTVSLAGPEKELTFTLLFSSLPSKLPVVQPATPVHLNPLRSFFPGGGVLIARTEPKAKPPFAAVLKGGNNDEPHNHNDVGSFSVVVGDKMVICDPGGEVYTKRTFSSHRYDSKVLSSFGHAVPVIAGKLQRAGRQAKGIILETNFSATTDVLKLNIRSAYAVPSLQKLERTFVFHRGKTPSLEVSDDVEFSQPESFETALITWGTVKSAGTNTLQITDGDRSVRVAIDTHGRAFNWHTETINEDVQTHRKPVRIAIDLESKLTNGLVNLRISPDQK